MVTTSLSLIIVIIGEHPRGGTIILYSCMLLPLHVSISLDEKRRTKRMIGSCLFFLFVIAGLKACIGADICVVSAVDIHLQQFSKFLEKHNVTVLQNTQIPSGRRSLVTPEKTVKLDNLKRGIVYITSDLLSSIRFLVRRHMAMEYSRLLHGNERWFMAQQSAGATKRPLFYYSRLAEVNSDKSRTALRLQMGPEDERMFRILEYANGYGLDPIGIVKHFHMWRDAAWSRLYHVPIFFVHMSHTELGERPYSAEVGLALNRFLGLHDDHAALYMPNFETKASFDVRERLDMAKVDKKAFASRVLNGTRVLQALDADMRMLSGEVFVPSKAKTAVVNS